MRKITEQTATLELNQRDFPKLVNLLGQWQHNPQPATDADIVELAFLVVNSFRLRIQTVEEYQTPSPDQGNLALG